MKSQKDMTKGELEDRQIKNKLLPKRLRGREPATDAELTAILALLLSVQEVGANALHSLFGIKKHRALELEDPTEDELKRLEVMVEEEAKRRITT